MPNFFMIAENYNNVANAKRLRDLDTCAFQAIDQSSSTMNWMEFNEFEGFDLDGNLNSYEYGEPFVVMVVPWMTHQEYILLKAFSGSRQDTVTAYLYNNHADEWAFYNAKMIWIGGTWNKQRGMWENTQVEFRELDEI